MNRYLRLGLFFGSIGFGFAACSIPTAILGCHNPTGYCGGNTPDPDRIGGPSWFLWQATAEERFAYFHENCLESDPTMTPRQSEECALNGISIDAHQYCVLHYKPPTRPRDDAERDERERNFEACKRDVLSQHGL